MTADWIAPARTALLLIDLQKDFVAGPMAEAVVAEAEKLAGAARRAGMAAVFVRLITRPEDESEAARAFRRRRGEDGPLPCREGTDGAAWVGPRPGGGDYVVSKSGYSAFAGTRLEESLKAMGRDTLLLAGLTTECCIAATAFDAFARNFHVFIAEEAVGAYDLALHQAALRALALNCAIPLATAEILAAWN
jgi:nicotinamidase-related amidase